MKAYQGRRPSIRKLFPQIVGYRIRKRWKLEARREPYNWRKLADEFEEIVAPFLTENGIKDEATTKALLAKLRVQFPMYDLTVIANISSRADGTIDGRIPVVL